MRYVIILLEVFFIVAGCQDPAKSYSITIQGVFSKNAAIDHFSISQFKLDHQDLRDIRPKSHSELMRYCVDLKEKSLAQKIVLFDKSESDYQWTLCKLDTSLLANDSLSRLPFEEKLKYLNAREQSNKSSVNRTILFPFAVRKGYVYQIFGLPDIHGSYYFCLSADDKFLVQYVDQGPW